MAGYPFQPMCNIKHESSIKLKILATAGGLPITRMVEQVIDYVYKIADKKKLKEARKKLNQKGR